MLHARGEAALITQWLPSDKEGLEKGSVRSLSRYELLCRRDGGAQRVEGSHRQPHDTRPGHLPRSSDETQSLGHNGRGQHFLLLGAGKCITILVGAVINFN